MKQFSNTIRLAFLIAFAAGFFLLPLQAWSEESAHIVLKDGTLFEKVDFKADYRHATIEFKVGDEKKYVSFTEIHAIIDSAGNDITSRIIGGYMETAGRATWLSDTSQVHREARRLLWHIGFAASGNLVIPFGDYYQGVDPGTGFGVELMVALSRRMALKASVSHSVLPADDDFVILVNEGSSSEYTVYNFETRGWEYYVCTQYYHLPDELSAGRFIPYVFGGVGIIRDKIEADRTSFDEIANEEYTRRVSDTETDLSLNIGLGIIYMVNRVVGVLAEIDIDDGRLYAQTHPGSGDYELTYGNQIGLRIGITALM